MSDRSERLQQIADVMQFHDMGWKANDIAKKLDLSQRQVTSEYLAGQFLLDVSATFANDEAAQELLREIFETAKEYAHLDFEE